MDLALSLPIDLDAFAARLTPRPEPALGTVPGPDPPAAEPVPRAGSFAAELEELQSQLLAGGAILPPGGEILPPPAAAGAALALSVGASAPPAVPLPQSASTLEVRTALAATSDALDTGALAPAAAAAPGADSERELPPQAAALPSTAASDPAAALELDATAPDDAARQRDARAAIAATAVAVRPAPLPVAPARGRSVPSEARPVAATPAAVPAAVSAAVPVLELRATHAETAESRGFAAVDGARSAQQLPPSSAPAVFAEPLPSAAVRPRSGGELPLLDLAHGRPAEALVARIHWLADQNVGEARIRLNPPELGALDIKLTVVDDDTFVHMTAQQPAARELLEAQMHRLREMLALGGLSLGGATVSGGERHASSAAALPAVLAVEPEPPEPAAPAASRPDGRGGRIDLYA